MEGSFACPECGTGVQVRGLAPGRQVRCGFCNRLLEVPYLPRAGESPWRRHRHGKPWWLRWLWGGAAVACSVLVAVGGARLLSRQLSSSRDHSINQLVESARRNESQGMLGQALIDLDAAIDMAQRAGTSYRARLEIWRHERALLARRDVQGVIDGLAADRSASFPLGGWLNLVARADRDPDLSSLTASINQQFQTALGHAVEKNLAAARLAAATGSVVSALDTCEKIASLLVHAAADQPSTVRSATHDLVVGLVASRGVMLEQPRGEYVFGSQTYVDRMLPLLKKALESKGFLPYRESSYWRNEWSHAPYQLNLDVTEQLEGSYLSSANRLTRIEARLTISSRGTDGWHWQTNPTARSTVPLPNLPAYLSSRVAMSRERSDEMEHLLYDNARGQIVDKFAHVLANMPPCPTAGQ